MKKLLLIILLFPFLGFAQNPSICDSLTINCCSVADPQSGTVEITVWNNSSDIFGYPGFILFDSNMDTIAQETVNFFGIGTGPSQHSMDITTPFTLPFTGTVCLYDGFFSNQRCCWPVTIIDSTLSIAIHEQKELDAYPNPATESVQIAVPDNQTYNMVLYSLNMQVVKSESFSGQSSFLLERNNLSSGTYILTLANDKTIYRKRIVFK